MLIKEMWRYPIKSMAGERVRESGITLAGIPGDRAISVVESPPSEQRLHRCQISAFIAQLELRRNR